MIEDTKDTFASKHTFAYEISGSQIEDVKNQMVAMQIEGEATIPEILEFFTKYLKAVGYFPPENHRLEFVPNEPPLSY